MFSWPWGLCLLWWGWCIVFLGSGACAQVLIDGTVATVGRRTVLFSDIEQERLRMRLQGAKEEETKTCHILENLLVHHLLLDQADLDSVPDFTTEAAQETEQRIAFFLQQAGSEKELEKQYGRGIRDIKKEMQTMIAEQRRVESVRQGIIKDVKVTPSQVRSFYEQFPEDSLSMVPESYIYRQLVLHPVESSEAEYRVRERLLELRERILKGERFSTLAMAYSEDRSSAVRGGEMGYLPRESFVKPFGDAAWSLQEGQVSKIVQTEFGFHIIQMIGRKGDLVNVRHILLKPSFTSDVIQRTITKLDSIRTLIVEDSVTFDVACYHYSDDESARLNGGFAVNIQRGGVEFTREEILPIDYYALQELQDGQISASFESRDLHGNVIVKILQLEKRIPTHKMNLEQDYADLQELTKRDKERKVFARWLQEKRKNIYIQLETPYAECEFNMPIWQNPEVDWKL